MKVLILDDDYKAASLLKNLLYDVYPEVQQVQVAQNTSKALLWLKDREFDVLFLDIEMPDLNGFEFIQVAGGVEKIPPVVFTTAHQDYALEAFKVRARDYILKPVGKATLKEAISRLANEDKKHQKKRLEDTMLEQAQLSNRLVIATESTYQLVPIQDIIRVEAEGSYSVFYLTQARKLMASKHLKHFEEQLKDGSFIRPHKSHLVNMSRIEGVQTYQGCTLVLIEGHRVPVSFRLKAQVLKALGIK
jgi:two-component system LytT family response regulator